MAPGGQQGTAPENIATVTHPTGATSYHGTSFAAAYVSGLAALLISNGHARGAVASHLVSRATTYPSHAPTHGHGRVRY